MIETERLILRPYREADRNDFAAVNGHPDVGAWLTGVLDRDQSDALMDRLNGLIDAQGFGFWAAEHKTDGRIVGAIGLLVMADDLPQTGDIQIAWRLHPEAQGAGLATEGAAAARDWAFANLPITELLAITSEGNLRSQAVMRRLGLERDPAADFDHARLAPDHPLRRHVLFRMARPA